MNIGNPNFFGRNTDNNPLLNGINKGLQRQGKRLANQKLEAQLPYIGDEEKEKLLAAQLGNQKTQIDLPFERDKQQAGLDQTLLGNMQKSILNKFLPQMQESIIKRNNNLADRKPIQGAEGQQWDFLVNQVSADNPQLKGDLSKVRDAINAYETGKTTLSDGTPLNTPKQTTLDAISRWQRPNTTAALLTNLIKGKQSEAENKVISKFISDAIKPYGKTFDGYSFEQIRDQFSSDPDSQKKLGRFLAAQTANIEQARVRDWIMGANPTISGLHDILGNSPTYSKISKVMQSGESKQEYIRALDELFGNMLRAREKVGIEARQGFAPPDEDSSSEQSFSPDDISNDVTSGAQNVENWVKNPKTGKYEKQ